MPKQYLGDSVYVDTDGWGCILTTENGITAENGMPEDASNLIYLEPEVMEALIRYYEGHKP